MHPYLDDWDLVSRKRVLRRACWICSGTLRVLPGIASLCCPQIFFQGTRGSRLEEKRIKRLEEKENSKKSRGDEQLYSGERTEKQRPKSRVTRRKRGKKQATGFNRKHQMCKCGEPKDGYSSEKIECFQDRLEEIAKAKD